MLGLLLHSYGTHCDHILWHLMATMTTVAPPVDCLWQFGSSFYRCRCKLRGPQNIIPPSSPTLLSYTRELWQMDFCGKEQQQQQQRKHVAGGKLSLCVCVFSGKMCHEASILLARE